MADPVVLAEIDDAVGVITLHRPEKRNAINLEVLESLGRTFAELAENPAVKVILLQGAGPAFSAGIDFQFLAAAAREDGRAPGTRLREGIAFIQTVLNRIERIEKPVAAKIHGFCGGLGLELALAADFRIAARSATLGLPEIILGLIPDCGGTARLTRLVGPGRAKELILTGDMISARRACALGLVHRVCPDGRLEETTRAFLARLRQRPPLALGLAKRAIDWGSGLDRMTHMEIEALTQSLLVTAADFPETLRKGLAALAGKEKG
jgi:enoyl-CoA hydratase/carnithine racemase